MVGEAATYLLMYGAGIASAVVAATAVRRRPRLRASWEAEHLEGSPPHQGLVVEVTVGRRPLEIEELGVLVRYGPRHRKVGGRAEVRMPGRPSDDLPALMTDGEGVRCGFELDGLIDDVHREIGDARLTSETFGYVRASGKEYRARPSGARVDQSRRALRGLSSKFKTLGQPIEQRSIAIEEAERQRLVERSQQRAHAADLSSQGEGAGSPQEHGHDPQHDE